MACGVCFDLISPMVSTKGAGHPSHRGGKPLLFLFFSHVKIMKNMRTYVYVDGFNLYHGVLKKTKYKWLDLKALFQKLLSNQNQIIAIKY